MIQRGKQRLAPFGDRVEYQVCDLRDPDWPAQVGGHSTRSSRPWPSTTWASPPLSAGCSATSPVCCVRMGVSFGLDLVLGARFAPAGSALGELYARGAPSHHPDPDADEHPHELPADVVAPTLEDHLCWLRDAGFTEVDCVWKQFSEVFLCGSDNCEMSLRTITKTGICTNGLVAK